MKSPTKVYREVDLDFEFNQTVEEKVNLVSCVTFDVQTQRLRKWWLHNDKARQRELAKYLKKFDLVNGFACVAECRSFYSLGLNPLDWKWYDMFFEYRMLTNHNDELLVGKQLVNGKVITAKKLPPKWERTEEDSKTGFRPTHSLAEATYKLTGKIRDTDHKTKMRNLIISNPKKFSDSEKKAILAYNAEDVLFLSTIKEKIWEHFSGLIGALVHDDLVDKDERREAIKTRDKLLASYREEALFRGRYAAHTAIMECKGYPIDVKKTRQFSRQVGTILFEQQREINRLFPNIHPFKWNKKEQRYSWDQSITKEWIRANHKTGDWMETDSGDISLALEAFEKFYQFKHDYPDDNLGAQFVKFLKLKQSLYGFASSPGGKKKNFWDSAGSDGRVRPYMNPFGAQSSRSQPGATGFMFLKPAWMRALVAPARGKFLAGIDFSGQEFFVSAILSGDEEMIEAYLSGDPYFYQAKLSRAVPMDGLRKDYEAIRDMFKSTTLGLSYLMTKYGLAIKLTNDTGREWDEDEAQEQIDEFYERFHKLHDSQEEIKEEYEGGGSFIRLPCVAQGTLIRTIEGAKEIEKISKGEILWDGQEWVRSGGAVRTGEKDVIHLKKINLSVTPDHWVLCGKTWRSAAELLGRRESLAHQSAKFLEDGRFSAQKLNYGDEGVSFVAAYAALKKQLESNHCKLEELGPVLTALNLFVPEDQSPTAIATFLMTNIFGENGKLVIGTLKKDAKIRTTYNSRTMEVAGYYSASTPFEISWNTLLRWTGIGHGGLCWTELTTTGTMSLETYESLLKLSTTKIAVYDILDCGPRNRFQAGDAIVHNCGWYMWGDNPNIRSVANVPVQGFSASVMRKSVDLAADKEIYICKTLHDALYMEDDIGEEEKIEDLRVSMRDAFVHYVPKKYKEVAAKIRLDPKAWSPNYPEKGEIIVGDNYKVPVSKLYIDGRAKKDYERFSVYFNERDEDFL